MSVQEEAGAFQCLEQETVREEKGLSKCPVSGESGLPTSSLSVHIGRSPVLTGGLPDSLNLNTIPECEMIEKGLSGHCLSRMTGCQRNTKATADDGSSSQKYAG